MNNRGLVASAGRVAICTAMLVAAAGVDASDQPASCDLFTVNGLTVDATRSTVRATLGRERTTTRIVREGRPEATAAEYGEGGTRTYVEYDHRIDRRPEPRVVLLRAAIPSTEVALADLVERWGAPTVWQDATTASPSSVGPVVWVDERCGSVATVFRRPGEWWSATGGTFLQVESLESVRRGESPASPVVALPAAPAPGPTQSPAP